MGFSWKMAVMPWQLSSGFSAPSLCCRFYQIRVGARHYYLRDQSLSSLRMWCGAQSIDSCLVTSTNTSEDSETNTHEDYTDVCVVLIARWGRTGGCSGLHMKGVQP